MDSFLYDIPVKVHFGPGQLCHLGEELGRFGRRVLLVYGGGSIKKSGLYDAVALQVRQAGLELFEWAGAAPNPRIDGVRAGVALCKQHNVDVVLAVGGGSVIDTAKFIAAGACVNFDPWEFFSRKAPLERALPLITVLTLAATGSEMDAGGVISNPETNDKIGRIARPLLPQVSFLDPTLTYTVSTFQTACGAADILSHVMEFYFSPQPDLYMLDRCMEAIMNTVVHYAPIALAEPCNYEARANLMWAASWAINGFITGSKPRAWSCHPMEHELSALYDITHGLGLAILTPRWLEYCLNEDTAPRYRQFGIGVFGVDPALAPIPAARKSIELLRGFLYDTLGLQSTFTQIGIGEENFAQMACKACGGHTLQGFRPLTQQDIEAIFKMCL